MAVSVKYICVYEIVNKTFKVVKRIKFSDILALTRYKQGQKPKFIIHIKRQTEDDLFQSDQIEKLIRCIKCCFYGVNGRNMPVYVVPDDIKQYATSMKVICMKSTILPDSKYLDPLEDLYLDKSEIKASTASVNISEDEKFFIK